MKYVSLCIKVPLVLLNLITIKRTQNPAEAPQNKTKPSISKVSFVCVSFCSSCVLKYCDLDCPNTFVAEILTRQW